MPDFYLDLIEEENMEGTTVNIETGMSYMLAQEPVITNGNIAQSTLSAPHGTPNAPTTATRKKRADAGTTRDNIYVYPSPAMRLDLQHADARDILGAWITGQIIEPEAAKRVSSVMGELIAHIDRLRKSQK